MAWTAIILNSVSIVVCPIEEQSLDLIPPDFSRDLETSTECWYASFPRLFLLLSATNLSAQPPSPNETALYRRAVYAGPMFTGANPSNATFGSGRGGSFRAFRWIAVAGEFSVYLGASGVANSTTLFDYLVGPRLSSPLCRFSRFTPFGDFLVGGQTLHNGSTQHSYYYGNGSGLALAGDAGMDFRLTRHLALRGQGGVVYSRFTTAPTTTSNARWRAGTYLVYSF